jgi:hypothetical protein
MNIAAMDWTKAPANLTNNDPNLRKSCWTKFLIRYRENQPVDEGNDSWSLGSPPLPFESSSLHPAESRQRF